MNYITQLSFFEFQNQKCRQINFNDQIDWWNWTNRRAISDCYLKKDEIVKLWPDTYRFFENDLYLDVEGTA